MSDSPVPAQEEAEDPASGAAAAAQPVTLPWLSDLDEAQRVAREDGKPVLVRVVADWCPSCRALDEAIARRDVQNELARWVLLRVDVTAGPTDIRELQTEAVPALIVRTPGGRQAASWTGFKDAAWLIAWLAEHYEAAIAGPDAVLLDAHAPDTMAVVRLVRQFGDRDPAVREAAIRRLAAHPEESRTTVVRAFAKGKLAARLTALEVLRAWKAPIDGIDPWQVETVSTDALARLESWAERFEPPDAADSDPAAPISQDDLADARIEIARLLRGTAAEAEAIAGRLAGFGQTLLPEVYRQLEQAETDADHERLLMLRYRLVAGDSLVLKWPGGLARLAATDPRIRQKAAEQLSTLVTTGDQALLLEMFADPDPLVREISLRGLQHIGGDEAAAALVKLLSDPEPNVRAAVLKLLEEAADADDNRLQARLVPEIAQYLTTETDPDLLVHALRFLRTTKSALARKSIMGLLEHESWQVRAEAAAAVGEFSGGQVEVYAALLKLLEDPDGFVVAKAVEGLSDIDMPLAVDPLINAATAHPDLAEQIIGILAGGETTRPKALPRLRAFCKDENPAIRAAAIRGLSRAAPGAMKEELAAALGDGQRDVRIAATTTLFEMMERQRDGAYDDMTESASGIATALSHIRPFPEEPDTGLLATAARIIAGFTTPPDPADAAEPPDTVEPADAAESVEEPGPAEPPARAVPQLATASWTSAA